MLTTTNPPKISKGFSSSNRKKIYTISNRSNNLFNVRIKDKRDNELTTVLSFSKHADAIKIASMLKIHYLYTKEWPDNLIDMDSNLNIFSDYINSQNSLKHLTIDTWVFNEFNEYCVNNLVDYLHITKFIKNRDNNYSIRGQLIKIVDTNIACAQILNNIYNKS